MFKFIKTKDKSKKRHAVVLISLLMSAMFLFSACGSNTKTENRDASKTTQNTDLDKNQKDSNKDSGNTNEQEKKGTQVNGNLKVHFIDVGQADSILITENGHSMLIDAGNNADANLVVNYLKSQGVSKLDYVIGTHPHEDHIGGLDVAINSFNIDKVYMPKKTTTTETYKDVINAIKNKNLKVTVPTPGTSFKLGDASCQILAPNGSDYEDANNYSIVIKITYGNNSFLLTGDAEDISEKEMLDKGYGLKADVLKVGHHGSRSSTTEAFLNKVNPKYAVISLGKGNDYGHPHKSTMDRLKSKNIPVYRTDESGTIVATSNGKTISFSAKAGSYTYNDNNKSTSNNKYYTDNSTSKASTGTTVKAAAPKVQSSKKSSTTRGLIKGNISSSGEKIYHMPGGAYYDRTNPEAWFNTEAEAQAAGYRRSKR